MSHPFSKPFTLDRTVRITIYALIGISIVLLFRYLSPVLLPFFIAWLIAYLLHPLVVLAQEKAKIKNRTVAVLLILTLIFALIGTLLYFLVPTLLSELAIFKDVLLQVITSDKINDNSYWQILLQDILLEIKNSEFLNPENLMAFSSHFSTLLSGSWSVVGHIFTLFLSVLYLFFILKDYNTITNHFIGLIPEKYQIFVSTLMQDLEQGMNNYYRGQFIVVMIVSILFSIGFSIINMPIAIFMGIIVGLLNIVPYMQVIGIPPCILLMLVHAIETGTSPVYSLLALLIVFVAIQGIQDGLLVPKIMGKQMGLNAAIILLSLSIFGMLFGVIGLIIALPTTTLMISYYKRYILKSVNENYQKSKNSEDPEIIELLRQ